MKEYRYYEVAIGNRSYEVLALNMRDAKQQAAKIHRDRGHNREKSVSEIATQLAEVNDSWSFLKGAA